MNLTRKLVESKIEEMERFKKFSLNESFPLEHREIFKQKAQESYEQACVFLSIMSKGWEV